MLLRIHSPIGLAPWERAIDLWERAIDFSRMAQALQTVWAPPWREDGEAYYLEIDLSGFRRKDLSVQARDSLLEIRAARARGFWSTEHRSLLRVVTLPDGADGEDIQARFANGQLCVRVAKRPSAKRRVLPIRVNGTVMAPEASSPPVQAPWWKKTMEPIRNLWARLVG